MTVAELYFVALTIIFTVPYLIWRLAKTDHWMPLVVVQILMGVILGPGVIGAQFPELYKTIFTQPVIHYLNGVALWAVSLFVFTAGIELDLGRAWQDRSKTLITSGMALIMPLIMGMAVGLILLQFQGWQGPKSADWQFVLGLGMAAAVTALPILVVLMEKMQILKQDLGQRVLRYASLDDIMIWSVLAIILMDWQRLSNQAIFLAAYVSAALLMRRFMPRLSHMDRWSVSLIWLVVCALLADWAGLHFMVGAFLSGVIIDKEWFDQDQLDHFRHTILMVMMPVFFLSTGLRTSWEQGGVIVIAVALLLLIAQITGKLSGVWLAGHMQGWAVKDRWTVGWLLQTKALIEIIFANVLLDKGIITSEMFTALLLMALASTMLTVPVVTRLLDKPAKY